MGKGKNDFLSPKAISNRIKAKGLQKLRWYCQMCGKQCRDENGFKCHLDSDSHKRQMMVFGEAPDRIIEGFSEEFEAGFMELLKRSHPFSRVAAKVVYNDYISNPHHVHMNSTKWLTLTEFVKYLGREGLCRVDETPKGWFISIIQEDPMAELSTKNRLKRDRAEREEEERHARQLAAQVERASEFAGRDASPGSTATAPAELRREDGDKPLAFGSLRDQQAARSAPAAVAAAEFDAADDDRSGKRSSNGADRPRSKMEMLMEAEKRAAAEKASRQQAATMYERGFWLRKGLVVKIMSAELKPAGLYKQKGIVICLVSEQVGEVELMDGSAAVQVHQSQLETVIPQPGGRVMVLNGPFRGTPAELVSIDVDKFQARVKVVADGKPRELSFEYEDICKVKS
mmetsp:Transcript_7302/g.21522  ORF Transcript_7302/g.21522 Transcript_7302/m.21522 type:complete len:400 (+) Transcript_7302:390-1589(+)